ncbi:hypothetical protein COLO4_24595 [Corchorus olitorius]|uniref:Uncharacterized protein n=1 Tax=Corchorus olitorius TaxID=93759 RepID=A0A1R3I8R8_9ROSI|nr:hypothetical protein COLO4_24595 [Corchorus olitorius]
MTLMLSSDSPSMSKLSLSQLFNFSTNAWGSGAMQNKRVIGLTFRLSSATLPYRIVGQSSAPDSTFPMPGNSPLYLVIRLLYSVYLYKSPNHTLLSLARMPVKKTNKNRKTKGLVRAFVCTRMACP